MALSGDPDIVAAIEAAEIEKTGDPMVYHYENCHTCGIWPIIGTLYMCKSCPEVRVCRHCKPKHNPEHEFWSTDDNDPKVVIEPRGVFVHPCRNLETDADHDLSRVVNNRAYKIHDNTVDELERIKSTLEIHPYVSCDGCHRFPIVGKRYFHRDFDLCEACYDASSSKAEFSCA